jgi:hypothetical protein
MSMSSKPVFADLLTTQVLLCRIRVRQIVLAPPVGLSHRPARLEEEVRSVERAFVPELALQHGLFEAGPQDDRPAQALPRRFGSGVRVLLYPLAPAHASPVLLPGSAGAQLVEVAGATLHR